MSIPMKGRKRIETTMKNDQFSKKELSISDFIDLHTDFIQDKMLENLSHTTIKDHKNIFRFFVRWIDQT